MLPFVFYAVGTYGLKLLALQGGAPSIPTDHETPCTNDPNEDCARNDFKHLAVLPGLGVVSLGGQPKRLTTHLFDQPVPS